ncbi:MAG: hypothetical protein EHM24_31670 [Acidobacteria bacterium]|nr:MAG: hypothetical protein EHM24_31670 [Acidobacteriota bacterium]
MASSFSGSGGRQTALWTEQMASRQRGELDQYARSSLLGQRAPLRGANYRASDYLQRGYGRASEQLNQGYDTGIATMQQALGANQTGYADAIKSLQGGYGEAADQWQPYHQQSMAGYGMYQNALGLGGAAGTAAAQGAFKAGPGYQWNVDQATNQAQRAANKVGGLYGGNTVDQTTRLASNLANQEYDKWVGNLQGFQGAAQASTGALADIYSQRGQGVAARQADQGQQLAGLYSGIGQAQIGKGTAGAALTSDYYGSQAGRTSSYGQSAAGLAGQYWGNLANNANQYYNTVIPAGQQGMQAGQQAAQNRMGAIMGGLQLGGQLLGGMGGGASGGGGGGAFGGFLSGFGKLFGK